MNDAQSSVDQRWRELSSAGNDSFEHGDDPAARALYVLALDEAADILARATAGDPDAIPIAPVLHTIACHNLAALERRSGNVASSRELLERALGRLVRLARDGSAPAELRLHAADNMRHAIAELVEHSGMSREALAPSVVQAMEAWLSARAQRLSEAASAPIQCLVM